jgi:1,2-phenylacetyl-CoA epoxidase PaaB subunit
VGDFGLSKSEPHRFEDSTMWEVFARRKFEEPLAHVGTVAADDSDLAQVYARTIFNEFTWVEMVLYPRPSSVTAIKT